MNDNIEDAINLAENQARSAFEDAWSRVVDEELPDYRIMIWGSVIEENKNPTDVDLIFEYTGSSISPEKEESLEGIIKSSVYTERFSYLDPLVANYTEVPGIISKSRISRTYSIDEDGWVNYD